MSVDLAPARRRTLPWLTAVCWLAVAGPAGWALVRLLGAEQGLIMLLLAFTPYVAAASVVIAVVVLALRRWWPGAVAVLAAIALIAVVLPRALPDADRGAGGGPDLRVLTANVLLGTADAGALAGLVREHDVDLLAVQEFSPGFGERLDAAGIAQVLPYRQISPQLGASGSALYSRHPLSAAGGRENPSGFMQSYATVTVPGAEPLLAESVHPAAPISGDAVRHWRRDMATEPVATPDGPVRLLLGDFNSTLDHPTFRALVATGYRDAADADGAGLHGTWGPYDGDPIPPVMLDHVLADERIRVGDVSVLSLSGSDHRPVLAQLTLPRLD